MASNDPHPVVKQGASTPAAVVPRPGGKDGSVTKPHGTPIAAKGDGKLPGISFDDAELYASRIRPSWEIFDDAAEGAVPDAAPAENGRAKNGADTIIDGVPTVAVDHDGGAEAKAPPSKPAPEAKPTAANEIGEARKALQVPSRGGKTQIGVGSASAKPVSKTVPEPEPASKPPTSKAPASKAPSSKPGQAVAAKPASRAEVSDDIEIPVTGASNKTFAKIGLAAAALLAVGAIGYGVLGGSDKKPTPQPTPTATVAAKAAVPLPATVPPPPSAEPEPAAPTATVAAAKPTASAAVTAAAAPTATATAQAAKAPDPKPEPKAKAEPKTEPKKAAAAPPPAAPKKGNSNIIRETPF